MALAFGLKIAWFCLSLSGLLACWVTFYAFGKAMGAFELPLLYCVGCSLLQGFFCLGLIWEMDPFRMPTSFCIAQSIFIGFGTFLISGVAAAFSLATSWAVLKPKTWGEHGKSILVWRHQYFLPVVVFPVVASAVQIGFTIIFRKEFQRVEDLHCDYGGSAIW